MSYKSGHIYLIDHEPTVTELANFAKPVQFDVCKNGLFYSILYDKEGNRFVEEKSKVITGFIKLGPITRNGNQVTIAVHPSGFNHWRINGIDITSSNAVSLILEPEQTLYRYDSLVGTAAGGLFILPGASNKNPIPVNQLDYPQYAFFSDFLITPNSAGLVSVSTDATLSGSGSQSNPLKLSEAKNNEIAGKVDKREGAVAVGFLNANKAQPPYMLFNNDASFDNYVQLATISWVNSLGFATQAYLEAGLANRYQITTTNISAPDNTYKYAIITDGSGVTRRLDLAIYLGATREPLKQNRYGSQNPPTLAELTAMGIQKGEFYVQTSNGSSSGTEIQRALFNGAQLVEWTVTFAVWNALSGNQKNAVKYISIGG